MNNRKDFIQWLTKIKGLSSKEQKSLMWKMDSLNRAKKVFETSDVEIIKSYGDRSLNLYVEFLSQAKQDTVIVESEEILDNKTPFVEISILEEQINVLENDYEKKKASAKEIQKNTFDKLSDVISSFENIGLDKYNLHKKDAEHNFENSLYVFDIVNGRFSDINNDISNNEMESYVKYDTKFYPRRDNAFYYGKSIQRQIGCMNAFEKNPLQREPNILSKSIEAQLKNGNDSKNMCLVPDTLGDFKDSIKAELKGFGKALVQIPRSIAAIYSVIDFENIDNDCRFCVFDFDCGNPCRTDIRIQFDKDAGEYVVIRMGRWILPSKTFGTYSQLVRLYIENYCKKYGVKIPDNCITNMISTRDILKVWVNQKSIMVEIDDGFQELKYDKEIIEIVKNEIISKINVDDDVDKYFVIFNSNSTDDIFINLSVLENGCKNILSRIKNKKIIWKEYLPKLELEVIRDGKFDTLKLISDEHIQNITATSMDEEVDIKVDNGIFTFPAKRDKILCPLTREEFGNKARDKMAMFYNPKILPLSEATDVTISLKYRYGDPDSYRLIATPKDSSFKEIVSEWCDDADNKMGNDKVPEYVPQINTTKEANLLNIISLFMENLKKPWYFKKTGGKNGSAPFDTNHNWFMLTPLIYNLVPLQSMLAPHNVDELKDSDYTFFNGIFSILVDLYKAMNEYTEPDDCDFSNGMKADATKNILNIISMLGGILNLEGCVEQETLDFWAETILSSNELQYIIQLSTYISRDDDSYGVWKKIDELLSKASGETLRHAIRTIGSVCWRSSNWIYEFSKCPNNIIHSVIDTAVAVCKSEIPKIGYDYNPRKVRDMLEALLGITRLKTENNFVGQLLDCNNKKVKDIVEMLKDLDTAMSQAEHYLKYKFVSRLNMEVPYILRNVSSVVYPLIEILTDGNVVKLTGFTED